MAQTEGSTTMRLVVGCCDNNVHLYRNTPSASAPEGRWEVDKRLPQVHGDWVRDVAWVPSGGMPYNMFASCSEVRLGGAASSVLVSKEGDSVVTNSC